MRRWQLLPGLIPGDILSSASQPRAVTQQSWYREEVTAAPLPGLDGRLLRYAGRSLLGLGQGRCWPYSQIPQPGIFCYINIHK